jgi:hypothetical protein
VQHACSAVAERTSHLIFLKKNEIFNPSPHTHKGNIAEDEAGLLLTRRRGEKDHPELHPGTAKKIRNLDKERSKSLFLPQNKNEKAGPSSATVVQPAPIRATTATTATPTEGAQQARKSTKAQKIAQIKKGT